MTRRSICAAVLFASLSATLAVARAEDASPTPGASATPKASASPSPTPTPGPPFGNMKFREIGPATAGGRVAAVAGSATDPKLYYIGSAGGGVWKTANGGQTWSPVFEKQSVAAIGAVTIDPTDDKTVWVGTGETNPRNDVSYGDGIYKSTDGGATWTNLGLKETKQISRIAVDPRNHQHVVVGALGDLFNDSTERGIFITDDGGKTWTKTLYAGPMSGVSDLAMDPKDPNVLYAGVWQFRRQPWTFQSGGPDDGLYKSTDGGRSWTKLTGHGLPEGTTGRIGLAIAPSNPNRVYALIEAKGGILWRSDDAGATWTMVSNNTLVDQRPFYFTHLAVDPKNPDRVYGVSEALSLSTDGGKTFKAIADNVHVDYHAIWIAPNDPTRIITGEDGGYALTVDAGENWFFSANLPISQVYRVGLSNENPYWVCAGLQDNNAWCAPNNTQDPSGIQNKAWIGVAGGDGEWTIPDPADPNYIWADSENGALTVQNKVTKDGWFVEPHLRNGEESFDVSKARYRFNWESPFNFAPWNPHIAWMGSNVVFQSTDRGLHWSVISPDLTRNLKEHQQPSGGPITHDVSGAEESDTILDIEGSTLRAGEMWIGTDDGLIQMTRDGGKHWSNVTPPGAPQYGRFASVSPSATTPGTAYAINDAHYTGDNAPHAYVTHDFGKTWTTITSGLPPGEWARAIRGDIHNRNLVYLGTEEGLWISYDGGSSWQQFKNNMPTVSVHDIRMQPQFNDLVVATHGRSVYVMDDMTAVQQVQTAVARGAYLFKPRTSYQYNQRGDDEGTYTNYAASNPPQGAMIDFYEKSPSKNPPKLEILDARGRAIRTYQGTHKVAGKDEPWVPHVAGLNRFVWNWTIDGPVKWTGAAKPAYQGPNDGPTVVPGRYAVRLTLDGQRAMVQSFDVKADPRTVYTQAQMVQAFELAQRAERQFSVVNTMLNHLDEVKKALDDASATAKKNGNTDLGTKIDAALAARKSVFDLLTANYQNDEDSIQFPGKIREDIQGELFTGGTVVTPALRDFAARADAELRSGTQAYNQFVVTQLPVINTALKAANLKPVPPSVQEVHQ